MEGIMNYLSVIICLLCCICNIFAQQDFYKISIRNEGIYRITGQELSNAGISINQIDPEKIQIFSDGNETLPYSTTEPVPQLNELSISVIDGNDLSFDLNDYLLFYGQSLNRFQLHSQKNDFVYISNPYDTLSYYWLRFNIENGKRIISKEASPSNPLAINKNVFSDRIHFEKEIFNPLKSGLTWTWNLFEDYDLFDVNFNINSVSNLPAEMNVRFSKYSFYSTIVNTGQVEIFSNGSLVDVVNVNNSTTISVFIPVQEGNNLLQFSYIPYSNQDTVPQVGVDWINLIYERSTIINDNNLKVFIDSSNAVYHVQYNSDTITDSILIFDISDKLNINQYITSNDSLFEDTLLNESKIYYFQMHNAYEQVLNIEQSNRNIFSPTDGADYLIICPEQWQSELLALQMHRNTFNGFVSKIINIEDIFNEFGFGRKDPTAIRTFIKFAYENWNPQPQYVVLAGNGYYDYKNITGLYNQNWIPAFEIDANLFDINSRAVDDFYVDVNFTNSILRQKKVWSDILPGLWEKNYTEQYKYETELYMDNFNNIIPELSIGRLPADNVLEIADLVQKIVDYETNFNPGLWRMSSLVISDDENPGDEFIFLSQSENLYNNYFRENSKAFKLYESDYPFVGNEKPGATRESINLVNQGKRITTFIGHAIESQWTHENLLNINRDITRFRNEKKYPFHFGLGKLYKYDDLEEGILDELIKNSNSGFIATLTANRPVYTGDSFTLFRNFLSYIINDCYCIGDALLFSKSGNTNSQKYHLLGDPALKINFPLKKSVQISINPDTIKAGGLVQISGQILDPINEDSLIVEILHPGKIISVGPVTYQQTGSTIFRGNIPLNNNNFMFQFVAPISAFIDTVMYGGNLYGYLWDNDSESMIIHDSLLYGGIDSAITDTISPQITMTLLKTDTIVNSEYLIAELFDESGINLSKIGNYQPKVIMDNNSDTLDVSGYFVYNIGSYQAGKIRFSLPPMEVGEHKVTLIVHDNFGNNATDSLHFFVSGTDNPGIEIPTGFRLFQNYPNPFNMQTTIPYEILGNDRYSVKIEIFNVLGQRIFIFERENLSGGKYLWSWNGNNFNNSEVSSGIYIYRLTAVNLKNNSYNFVKSMKMLLVK
jgi:hypothetical protein